jgi:hypothetical protein
LSGRKKWKTRMVDHLLINTPIKRVKELTICHQKEEKATQESLS